jgi:hypothetical protein
MTMLNLVNPIGSGPYNIRVGNELDCLIRGDKPICYFVQLGVLLEHKQKDYFSRQGVGGEDEPYFWFNNPKY